MAGLDLPLDVHKIGYSPDELALDKLINYYESRICALMGVDPMVCGLGSGTLQKTYANLSEALNDFWERQIVPLLKRHASTLTAQLFPSFGLDARHYRLSFDTSNVPALQENIDALFTRWRELYNSGGCDLYTLQTQIGLPDVPQEYKGHFNTTPFTNSQDSEIKGIWDERLHPRDLRGRFEDGGNGSPISKQDTRDHTTKQFFNNKLNVEISNEPEVKRLSSVLLGRELSSDDWKALSSAPDGHNIRIKPSGNSIEIRIEKGTLFKKVVISKIYPVAGSVIEGLTTARAYLELESVYREGREPPGLVPRMLDQTFKKSRSLGMDFVFANAAGDSSLPDGDNGWRRWPELGFEMPISTETSEKFDAPFRGITSLNELFEKGGGEQWKKHGHGGPMWFDLNPKSSSTRLFDSYCKIRGIQTTK